jgi:Kef-type K+ transport system membrane component KefB
MRLLLGLLLGPSLLNRIAPGETRHLIWQIGVIVLMVMAGLASDLSKLLHVGKASFLTALGGVLTLLSSGNLLGSISIAIPHTDPA